MAVYVIAFPSSYFFLFFYLLQGRGCLEERVAETPLPPLALWQARTTGPGDRKRGGDVHGQNVPLGTSVDTPSKLTLASSWRWLAALKAEWNGRRKHSRDFLPWSTSMRHGCWPCWVDAGIRNGISQTFPLRARGSSGRGGSGRKGV